MQRIFLIGYMGAGKTTLGKALAKTMGLTFIDLDHFIEGRQHKTVSQIFAAAGEEGFREAERRALAEVAAYEDVVVALGGGTPCFFDNMDVVCSSGTSVYLRPTEEVLLRRLAGGRAKRPVIAALTDAELRDFIHRQLAAREPHYLRADIHFESSHLENKADIDEAARSLAAAISVGTSTRK